MMLYFEGKLIVLCTCFIINPHHGEIQIRKQSLKLAFFFRVNTTTRQKNVHQQGIITCAAIPYNLHIKLKLSKCSINCANMRIPWAHFSKNFEHTNNFFLKKKKNQLKSHFQKNDLT